MALIRTAEGLLEAEKATLTEDQKDLGDDEIVKMLTLSKEQGDGDVEELAKFLGVALAPG